MAGGGVVVVDRVGLVLSGGALRGATDCGIHGDLLRSDPTRRSVLCARGAGDVKLKAQRHNCGVFKPQIRDHRSLRHRAASRCLCQKALVTNKRLLAQATFCLYIEGSGKRCEINHNNLSYVADITPTKTTRQYLFTCYFTDFCYNTL